MRRCSLGRISVFIPGLALSGFLPAAAAFAWQSRAGERPAGVDLTAELVEAGDAALEADEPAVSLPPRLPAPRIAPVEEFMAPQIPLAESSRRTRHPLPVGPATLASPRDEEKGPTPQAAVFKQAQPGTTTLAQLKQRWGEPEEEAVSESGTVLTYAAGPFPRIQAVFNEDILHSIVVYLKKPAAPQQVEKLLGLEQVRPVEVFDGDGGPLGQTYPERGITLSYAAAGEPTLVAHLMLETVTAEPFLLRAKNDRFHRWQQDLRDLETALALDPKDARAWWLKAEILSQQSEFRAAAVAIEQALLLEPEVELFQLTAARLIGEAGHYDDAIAATRAVAERPGLPPLLQARAAMQMGDLLADSPRHDYAQALSHHQQAIAAAMPLAAHARGDVRRAAKRVLVDGHMAVAAAIAKGDWKDKPTAVPKWFDRAQALVNEMISSEAADVSLSFDVACRRLEAYTWLDGEIDPGPAVEKARQLAQELAAQSGDATYGRQLAWQLGKALVDAVDIERSRRNAAKALAFGEEAEKTLAKVDDGTWNTGRTKFQLSRLSFLMGSLHAVQRQDHAAAVLWFDKALADISRPEPDADLTQTAQRGEWMVSMGISYWEQGDRRRGLRLTELGAGLIEAAHLEGAVKEAKLIVPYSNLAHMHKESGDAEKAEHFSRLSGRIDSSQKR